MTASGLPHVPETSSHQLQEHPFNSYRCTECNARFINPELLLDHLQQHIVSQILPLKCGICRMSFDSFFSLHKHKVNDHTEKTVHRCGSCKQAFMSPLELLDHMNDNLVGSPIECDKCGKIFHQCEKFKRHSLMHHLNIPAKKRSVSKLKHSVRGKHYQYHSSKRQSLSRLKHCIGSNVLKCSLCPKLFLSPSALRMHVLKIHATAKEPLVCTVCKKEFFNEEELRRHVWSHVNKSESNGNFTHCDSYAVERKRHSLEDLDLKSSGEFNHEQSYGDRKEVCSEKVQNFVKEAPHCITNRIQRNPSIVSQDGAKQLNCSFCPRKFKYNARFLKHLLKHTQEESVVKTESKIGDNTVNFNEVHSEIPQLSCKEKVPLQSIQDTRNNRKEAVSLSRICDEDESMKTVCIICCRKFKRLNHLNNHLKAHFRRKLKVVNKKGGMKSQGENSKLHVLPETGMTENYKSSCELLPEMLSHQVPVNSKIVSPHFMKYQCGLCEKSFKHEILLKQHMKMHHGYESQFGVVFRHKKVSGLKRMTKQSSKHNFHLSSVGDLEEYECDKCGEKFKLKQYFKAHTRLHYVPKGYRPFSCEVCPWKFISSSHLKEHMFIHTGYPYMCNSCPRRFKRKSFLDQHIIDRHKKVDWT